MKDSSYALLVKCARLQAERPFYTQLQTTLSTFTEWDTLITRAEAHSLAPLLYYHIQQSNTPIPASPRLQLQGLSLRHRRANAIRLQILLKILQILDKVGIMALVLKGGALAPLVYPEPGLRPMNDLDLLVPETAAASAQNLLQQAGFQPNPATHSLNKDHHHLPALMLRQEGLIISVEIHRRLFSGLLVAKTMAEADLWKTALPFRLHDHLTYTLSPIHMLWHLYQHALSEPTRLIRLVDLVAVAEKYADEIDWSAVHHLYPQLIAALSNLHFVSPLSTHLRQQAGITLKQKPKGAAFALADWPPLPRRYWRNKTTHQIVQATFFPSEFSLRFYYGIPNNRTHLWHRWLHHPRQILFWWLARRSGKL